MPYCVRGDNFMYKPSELLAQRMKAVVKQSGFSTPDILERLKKLGCDISQPTLSRFLAAKIDPPASFVSAFCQVFDVSADSLLVAGSEEAIDTDETAPETVLQNLCILLKQFDFKVELDSESDTGRLVTDDKYMKTFLFTLHMLPDMSFSQIAGFCKTYCLALKNKAFVMKEAE